MSRIAPKLFLVSAAGLVCFACQRTAIPPTRNPATAPARAPAVSTAPATAPAVSADDAASVPFKIQEVSNQKTKDGDEVTWLATHESKSGVAKFRIRMVLKQLSGDIPLAFSKGAFLREKGSQPAGFLRQVAKALEAKGSGGGSAKVDSLDFTVALLGLNQSRDSGPDQAAGGFSSTPSGDWIVTKVFVADGEGEFYLNLNPKEGVAEISLKDSEYGDIVLKELAKIL